MPFTISHAAAVLPFARPLARWRLLSATIIGCMVPDFGFLMLWRPSRADTHSALSLLTFCLPVGLTTFWIFQYVLKRPLIAVLPNAAYLRWRDSAVPAVIRSPRQWLAAAGGVLAGAVTHLVWDAFTHEGARGVRMIPMLDDPVVDIAGHRLIGARLWQDVSSIVGLVAVIVIVAYGLRRSAGTPTVPERTLTSMERYTWICAYLAAAALFAALFLAVRLSTNVVGRSWALMVGNWAVASLRGFAAALVLVSVCLQIRLRATP